MVNQGIALEHVTFERGIEVDKSKIDLIRSFRSPTSVKEVHSFLGHAGFYRRFVKGFSKIALPLCNLLQKDTTFDFNEKYQKTFKKLIEVLTSALAMPMTIRLEPCWASVWASFLMSSAMPPVH